MRDFDEVSFIVERAIAVARGGDLAEARRLFAEALARAGERVDVLVWLAVLAETAEVATDYFYRVLGLEPDNEAARQGIEWALQWMAADEGRPPLPAALAAYDVGVPVAAALVSGPSAPPAAIDVALSAVESPPMVVPPPPEAPLAESSSAGIGFPGAEELISQLSALSEGVEVLAAAEAAQAAAPAEAGALSEVVEDSTRRAELLSGEVAPIESAEPEAPPQEAELAAIEVVAPLAEPAVEPSPPPAAELYQRGAALLDEERFAEAATALQAAVDGGIDGSVARQKLAVALYRAGQWAATLEALRALLAASPERADLYANRGFVLQELGRHRDAASAFRDALARDDRMVEAQVGLAESLSALEQYNEAARAWRRAVELRPDLPLLKASLAEACGRLNREDEAISWLNQAVIQAPAEAVIRLRLGQMLLARHRFDDAAAQFGEALSLDPNSADALAGLEAARGIGDSRSPEGRQGSRRGPFGLFGRRR